MPLNSTLLPNASADVVGVYEQSGFNQVFPGARPIKATVMESSKLMEHPVETGITITDHRVILPTEIELSVFLLSRGDFEDYRSVYEQIRQYWRDATLLTVQTRTASYPDMVIMEMPHDEDSDIFNAVAVAIKMRQVLFVQPEYGTLPPSSVENPTNASTVSRGEQQTTAASVENTDRGSLLYQGYQGVFGP